MCVDLLQQGTRADLLCQMNFFRAYIRLAHHTDSFTKQSIALRTVSIAKFSFQNGCLPFVHF